MAVTVTNGVHIQYTPGFPFAGIWAAEVRGQGAAGGGAMTLSIVPNSPFERIFRIDGALVLWSVLASAAAFTDSFRYTSVDPEQSLSFYERFDASGSSTGSKVMDIKNPLYWNSHNEGQIMLQFGGINLDTQDWDFRAFGVFYEPRANSNRAPFIPELVA